MIYKTGDQFINMVNNSKYIISHITDYYVFCGTERNGIFVSNSAFVKKYFNECIVEGVIKSCGLTDDDCDEFEL